MLGELLDEDCCEWAWGIVKQAVYFDDFAVRNVIFNPVHQACFSHQGRTTDDIRLPYDPLLEFLIIFIEWHHPLGVECQIGV